MESDPAGLPRIERHTALHPLGWRGQREPNVAGCASRRHHLCTHKGEVGVVVDRGDRKGRGFAREPPELVKVVRLELASASGPCANRGGAKKTCRSSGIRGGDSSSSDSLASEPLIANASQEPSCPTATLKRLPRSATSGMAWSLPLGNLGGIPRRHGTLISHRRVPPRLRLTLGVESAGPPGPGSGAFRTLRGSAPEAVLSASAVVGAFDPGHDRQA